VAFPGGVRDSDDRSPIATALRDAQEEVAIPPEAVRVIGVLPPVTSSTGFQVTPGVGLLPADICWLPNEGEVESVFEMPLAVALRLSRYTPLDIQRAGQLHRVWLSW
ncbi:CoA pyrophosphatase, partial [Erwinia amylovora]|uniref:CoA pyrophosphatase n=1 Tax=Erwinia amylovora TaxID=552 RepID=UPI00200B5720